MIPSASVLYFLFLKANDLTNYDSNDDSLSEKQKSVAVQLLVEDKQAEPGPSGISTTKEDNSLKEMTFLRCRGAIPKQIPSLDIELASDREDTDYESSEDGFIKTRCNSSLEANSSDTREYFSSLDEEMPNNLSPANSFRRKSSGVLFSRAGVINDIKGVPKRDNKLRKIGLIDDLFFESRGKQRETKEHKSRYSKFKQFISRSPFIDFDQKLFLKHKKKMLEIIVKFEEIYCAARNLNIEAVEIRFRFDIYDFKFTDQKDSFFIDDLIYLYRKINKMLKKKNKILNLPFFSEFALKNILVLHEISRKLIDSTNDTKKVLPLILRLLN